MNELRKQFEVLPSIKTFLMSFDYDEKSNEYVRSKLFTQPEYTLGFFNGAWYAFQEQQKQLDEKQKYIDHLHSLMDGAASLIREGNDSDALELLK